MAKQCGPATFLGTYMDIIGYADDDRALVRMNGVMNKAKWKRHPSFERTREAARYFGAASVIAAGIWKNVPRGLKWIMEGDAYGRLVAACRGLVGEDGNLSDPEGLLGVDLNGWSLPELRDERLEMRVSGAAVSDERSRMKDECARAGSFDESPSTSSGTRMKDESRSLLLGRKRKYVMAEPFTDHEDPDFVVEHERLGTIESFREGLRELRALEGRPVVRRRRTWVAACEIGSVELVLGHGKKGKFFLEQRGRYWLGKADYCSEWVVDGLSAKGDAELMRDESGKMKVESDLGHRIGEVVREASLSSERCEKRTGWFVVIVGTEVAEKRGRHWVRLPYCCRVRVEAVMEQNSLNLQNCSHLSPFGGVPRFDRNGHDVLHNGGLRSMQSQKTLLELEGIWNIDVEVENVAAVDTRLESEMPVSVQTEKVDLVCDCTCLEYKFREIGDWGHFEPGGLILDLRARPPSWEDWPRFRVCDCHAIRAG